MGYTNYGEEKMGLFDKLKSLISRKEKVKEEVKKEYNVEDVS